jgi:hypothetical protein
MRKQMETLIAFIEAPACPQSIMITPTQINVEVATSISSGEVEHYIS